MIPKLKDLPGPVVMRYPTKDEMHLQHIAAFNILTKLQEDMFHIWYGGEPFNEYADKAIKNSKQSNTVEYMMGTAPKMLYYYIKFIEER